MLKNSNIMRFPDLSRYRNYDDASIESDDIQLINSIIGNQSDWISGNNINILENLFKKYLNIKYAFSFSHGRVALSAILKALNLNKGDEVILPAYTCVVVPNSIIFEKLTPVYCDIELETFGLDINKVRTLINSKTRVIIFQHLYGLVSKDYEDIINLCKDKNIYLVNDVAQSTGAEFRDEKLGIYGTAAMYSMQHSKIISSGNGGIAATNDDEIGARINHLQKQASIKKKEYVSSTLFRIKELYYSNRKIFGYIYYKYNRYRHIEFPINICVNEREGDLPDNYFCKLPNALASIALNQIKKIDKINEVRKGNGYFWYKWCKQNKLYKPTIIDNSKPVFLRYPLLAGNSVRQKIIDSAKNKDKNKIGFWFDQYLGSGSINRQLNSKSFPNASKAISQIINLPTL